jgi:hypothetical protein
MWELITRKLPYEEIASPHIVMYKVAVDGYRYAAIVVGVGIKCSLFLGRRVYEWEILI